MPFTKPVRIRPEFLGANSRFLSGVFQQIGFLRRNRLIPDY